MQDATYAKLPNIISEFSHRYGDHVHILSSPYLLTLLAQLGAPETVQPKITKLVETLYQHLLTAVIDNEFPKRLAQMPTRMQAYHPNEGHYEGQIVDPSTRSVVVSVARAGTIPAQYCYLRLHDLLDPPGIRQDFILMNRVTNEENQVIGAHITGYKIGGSIEDAIILMPDPMGATGGSICRILKLYQEMFSGKPKRWIALNLIVTPEYIRRLTQEHPEVVIYALRLDRGLSPLEVLNSIPGTYWEKERGLNERQYIVPGAGGLGEVFNNSFV